MDGKRGGQLISKRGTLNGGEDNGKGNAGIWQ